MIIQRIWRSSGFIQTPDGKQKKIFEKDENAYFHEYDPQDDFGVLLATQIAMDVISVLAEAYQSLWEKFG